MTRALLISMALLVSITGLAGAGRHQPDDPQHPPEPDHTRHAILVFSKTAGFRHGSIPDGVAAIRALGKRMNVRVDHTEDADAFTEPNLARYRAVIFLSTTGDVLDDAQQTAFQSYVEAGGGYVGIHAAADTEYDWPFYGRLVGAYFKSHPAVQQATIRVEDQHHPSTSHLPAPWTRADEWYNYRANPRENVQVLLSLDEETYQGGDMGDHPIAWCHQSLGGRAFYTGLGHTRESFRDKAFLQHLAGGILWAAGLDRIPDPDPSHAPVDP